MPSPPPPLGARRRAARAEAWGAWALLLRPAYVGVELLVAAAATGGYSLVTDSVSTLGQVGCSPASCSPRHELMNAAFVVSGALLVVGAALLARSLGRVAAGLLVVSGVSSAATGLAPLDEDVVRHAVAAVPLFVAQPVALLVLGTRLRVQRPGLARWLLGTGAVSAAAAVAFVLPGGAASGAWERLALWPVLLALAAYGGAHRRGALAQVDRAATRVM